MACQVLGGIGSAQAKPGFVITGIDVDGVQKGKAGLAKPVGLLADLPQLDMIAGLIRL